MVDKPSGWTSFDVVNYVRKIVATSEGKKPRNCKVGHTGTLDPLATGLLVVLVGKQYTRRAAGLTSVNKTYVAQMKLGQTSTTGDEEGEKTAVSPSVPTELALQRALKEFTGTIMQTPPAFSAKKIEGKRAYDLARAGKVPQLKPQKVTVYALQMTAYSYPYVALEMTVSSGTYVRSLVADIGERLETGAYMSALRRTRVSAYQVEHAVPPQELDAEKIKAALLELEA